MNNDILLSLCIPTYNRAEVLDNTLKSLFSNPDFDADLIEVIVSDNCSTDNTMEVVGKYPLVKYYRNEVNVRDVNFSIALSYATGAYVRLFNDTLSFKKNCLQTIINKIAEHLQDKKNIFFYSNMFLNSNCVREVSSKEAYIAQASFGSTWIANFGVWREDFVKIENKERYAHLQFTQVDWTYQIVNNKKPTVIYFEDLFDVAIPNKKGGYNVFDIFVNKYLFIIKQEKLSFFNYELEKYRLCRYFVYPWFVTLTIAKKENFDFEIKGVFKIIFKKYWYEPYFYPMLLLFFFRKLIK
ncbi:glycosyltransferase family 2 protein [Flavobacterium psychroterrae]|uniref:Glycosyltransferase family 2 protein n=1 Tax=Flavobacterium psychroterrae TaxID=2133767 RepID=A0ABS5PDI7_9FLAO|nr:glycosyltransferase family 2 protein [Flavobacterium psychroterrae]MBS7231925.1 glycosyltransferase family 2 protein [Flavobacterium psychroterrae]